jgi:hypothetical protein
MARLNANASAWAEVFEKHQVLESVSARGFADLTAKELGQFREARHLGKIDHEENLPPCFSENQLSILTTSNSSYRVGPFKTFQKLPKWQTPGSDVETLSFPKDLETLDFNNLTGEPGVINAAHASEMLTEFCGEQVRLTVAGRMRTPDFSYEVDTFNGTPHTISVDRAQIEIDGGYEGSKAFYVFEVKNHSASNFNLRQLYYPFRTWLPRIKKPVVPIFLTLSNDVFDFYKFDFDNPLNYSSAKLTSHKRFMLQHSPPAEKDLVQKAKEGLGRRTPHTVPFPQADDFEKVIDLVSIMLSSPKTVDELSTYYGFDPRQSDYYFNAAKFLGLGATEKREDGVTYRIATSLAQVIFSKPYREKYSSLAALVLGIDSVAKAYLDWMQTGIKPSKARVEAILSSSSDSDGLGLSTIDRRASTVLAWANWAHSLPYS